MASKQISPRQSIGTKLGVMMKQPTLNFGIEDKNSELKNFKLEVINVVKSYAITDVEETALIKKWLGRKGLQLLETITEADKKNVKHLRYYIKH